MLETLKNKKIIIPHIQAAIDSIYESLRCYRNAVFHPQPEYISPKLLEIMKDTRSVEKIWSVHSGLGKFFLDELNNLKLKKPSQYVQAASSPTK